MGSNASTDGIIPSVAGKQSVSSLSSASSQSAKEYDFSSLTQGFFAKHWKGSGFLDLPIAHYTGSSQK